jgi:hypothetical protein
MFYLSKYLPKYAEIKYNSKNFEELFLIRIFACIFYSETRGENCITEGFSPYKLQGTVFRYISCHFQTNLATSRTPFSSKEILLGA